MLPDPKDKKAAALTNLSVHGVAVRGHEGPLIIGQNAPGTPTLTIKSDGTLTIQHYTPQPFGTTGADGQD